MGGGYDNRWKEGGGGGEGRVCGTWEGGEREGRRKGRRKMVKGDVEFA